MDDRSIHWLRPIVTDGVVRWPPCDDQVTDPQARQHRDDNDQDCALSAKVSYRGKNLCKRHAAKLLLREFVQPSPDSATTGEQEPT